MKVFWYIACAALLSGGGCASSSMITVEVPAPLMSMFGPKMEVVGSNKTNFFLELFVLDEFVAFIAPGGMVRGTYRCGIPNAPVPMVVRAFADAARKSYIGCAYSAPYSMQGYPAVWEIRNVQMLDPSAAWLIATNFVRYPARLGDAVTVNIPSFQVRSETALQIVNNTRHDAVLRLSSYRGKTYESRISASGGFHCSVIGNDWNTMPIAAVVDVAFVDERGNFLGGFSREFSLATYAPYAVQFVLDESYIRRN